MVHTRMFSQYSICNISTWNSQFDFRNWTTWLSQRKRHRIPRRSTWSRYGLVGPCIAGCLWVRVPAEHWRGSLILGIWYYQSTLGDSVVFLGGWDRKVERRMRQWSQSESRSLSGGELVLDCKYIPPIWLKALMVIPMNRWHLQGDLLMAWSGGETHKSDK